MSCYEWCALSLLQKILVILWGTCGVHGPFVSTYPTCLETSICCESEAHWAFNHDNSQSNSCLLSCFDTFILTRKWCFHKISFYFWLCFLIESPVTSTRSEKILQPFQIYSQWSLLIFIKLLNYESPFNGSLWWSSTRFNWITP